MDRFLTNNRLELIARCRAKVAQRPHRAATTQQLANGIPLFLDQLTRTLQAEIQGDADESLRISGASGGEVTMLTEMGVSAAAHGKQLLELGFTVDQVVHDYGDLCQSITDLAVERDAPFTIESFRTLNRCLDNAIADAVTEFAAQRDVAVALKQSVEANERLGFLVHELRNYLQSGSLALTALESGKLPINGSTGAVLRRSLVAMTNLMNRTLDEVRATGSEPQPLRLFSLAMFIEDTRSGALLDARARECSFSVAAVDPRLGILGNRELLMSALVNLLQNAFKFTHKHTQVSLNAYALEERVVIDVVDNCGGLPPGSAESMFKPFVQRGLDRTGLGLGLSIARRNVEADGGTLTVRDIPGTGCVFTIALERRSLT